MKRIAEQLPTEFARQLTPAGLRTSQLIGLSATDSSINSKVCGSVSPMAW
jgi:hypothetical protein